MMALDFLFKCPICERDKFTAAGLRNHRCRALPQAYGMYQQLPRDLANKEIEAQTRAQKQQLQLFTERQP